MPGTGGDVVRALTVMPGVVNLQVPLGYSGVVIRGIVAAGLEGPRRRLRDPGPVPQHRLPRGAAGRVDRRRSTTSRAASTSSYGRASSGIVALTTRPGSDTRTHAGRGVVHRRRPARARPRRQEDPLHVRASPLDDRLRLAVDHPASADLSLTTVPSYWDGQFRIDHQLNSKWQLSLSERRHDRHVRALRDEGHRRRHEAVLQPHAVPPRSPAARSITTVRGRANLALSGLLPEFIFEAGAVPEHRRHAADVTPRAEVIRTCARGARPEGCRVARGGEAQVGHARHRPRAAARDARGRADGHATIRSDVTDEVRRHVLDPGLRGVDRGLARTSIRASASRVGLRGDAFARPGEITSQPRGELKSKLDRSVTARLSAGAYRRPPEFQSELLETNLESEHSTQTIAGLQYEPREGAARADARPTTPIART